MLELPVYRTSNTWIFKHLFPARRFTENVFYDELVYEGEGKLFFVKIRQDD